MNKWWFAWCCAVCFLLGASTEWFTLIPRINDLKYQLERCKDHNRFLEDWNKTASAKWKEHWRQECGCITTAELMNALTIGGD